MTVQYPSSHCRHLRSVLLLSYHLCLGLAESLSSFTYCVYVITYLVNLFYLPLIKVGRHSLCVFPQCLVFGNVQFVMFGHLRRRLSLLATKLTRSYREGHSSILCTDFFATAATYTSLFFFPSFFSIIVTLFNSRFLFISHLFTYPVPSLFHSFLS
jgi:hypothetical protein